MIDVGLIGYGFGGRVFHAPLIALAPDLRLRAVCSRSAERQDEAAAAYPGVATYGEEDALLADDQLGLVVVATPHDTHASLAIAAMDAGKHVVTDKIMCLTSAEGEAMLAAAQRNDVRLSVYQNRRWDGDFLTIRRILDEGALGEIYCIESSITRFGGPNSGWRAWRKHGGGHTLDWGAHLVDQALQLFGPTVQSVFADFQYDYPPDVADVETTAFCMLRFENGVRFRIELGTAWAYPKPRFHVRGSNGSLRKYGIDPQEAAMKLGTFGMPIPEDPARYEMKVRGADGGMHDVPVTPIPGSYRAFYDSVGQALSTGGEMPVDPRECLAGVRVFEAIFRSAAERRVVALTVRQGEAGRSNG